MRGTGTLVGAVAVLLILTASAALATPPIAAATRTTAFVSTSTASVAVPLRDDDTTTLKFSTIAANETVVITYNAECVVTAERGVRLTIRILVDGEEAEPSAGTDFSLCSAVDVTGATWASAVRQSVVTVPEAGKHIVKIAARLRGGTGTWRLDDTSLVVQRGVRAFATRDEPTESSSTIKLPIKQSGGRQLGFKTTAANEILKLTYNAECVVAAEPGSAVSVLNFVADAAVHPDQFENLCDAVDTTGKTPTGATRQIVVAIPEVGNHIATVSGAFLVGSGTGRVDDSSLVITEKVLASGVNNVSNSTNSTAEQAILITEDDGKKLNFTTTKDNQVVRITFNALCLIRGTRGRWVGVRIEVDGVEAQPASGYDFALCSSVQSTYFRKSAGFRQSVITIANPGVHTVRVFAKVSGSVLSWSLNRKSLVVE